MRRLTLRGLLAASLIAVPATALANLGASQESATDDPHFAAGRRAIEAQDWPAAVEAMRKAVAANPRNADAHNWMGYAYRKQGNFEASFAAYAEALRLDPNHKAAHEYLGEAYLATGQLAKAQGELEALKRLCTPIPCEELKDLQRAIDDYKKKAQQ
jgi:Flp pilus assembly protein TadD